MSERLEQRTFIQSLSTQQRRALTRRVNRPAMIRLFVLCACLLCCSAAIVLRQPFVAIWMLVQGVLLVSLFHLLHECVHDTVFKQRWPNRVVAHCCGFILFLPAIWFRYFHREHHRYTQQLGKDPELESDKPASLGHWLVHVSGATIWKSQFGLLFGALVRPCKQSYLPENKRFAARFEMLLMLIGYASLIVISIMLGSLNLLYAWIVPLLLGQPFLRLYLLAEHTDCEADANMFRNTRTVLTNPVLRWFTWNMPYHTEHHVYPAVPFHKLPELHALTQAYLVQVETGYLAFNQRYAQQVAAHKSP